MTDLQTLSLALNDVVRRARADRRYLDVGVLEGVIAYLSDQKTAEIAAAAPEPKRRGRPSKSNGTTDSPASVADLK